MSSPPPAFAVENATFRYRRSLWSRLRRPAPLPVLNRVTATIPAGGVTAVLGRSGSGKTTLLSLLGLLGDRGLAAGRIAYHGDRGPVQNYARLSGARRAALRRAEFGFVLQSCYLLPHFSCLDNIAMPLALQGVSPRECRRRVERLVDLVGADSLRADLARRAGGVSGGQKQRTAVLRAVVHDPAVLFADEPVSNLDEDSTERVLELFARWRSGTLNAESNARRTRTLVLVTHDVELAHRLADSFLLIWKPDPRAADAPHPVRWLAKREVSDPAALRALLHGADSTDPHDAPPPCS